MCNNSDDSAHYYVSKSLVACHVGWSVLPLLSSSSQLPIFIVTLLVSIITLNGKNPFSTKRVLVIWLSGIITSLTIVLILSNQMARVALYAICLLILCSILLDEINPDNKATKQSDEEH